MDQVIGEDTSIPCPCMAIPGKGRDPWSHLKACGRSRSAAFRVLVFLWILAERAI